MKAHKISFLFYQSNMSPGMILLPILSPIKEQKELGQEKSPFTNNNWEMRIFTS